MKLTGLQLRLLLSCLFLMSGCAAPKPILYPNAHLRQVGASAAEQDIEDCAAMAKEAGATSSQGKGGQVAGSTTAGGAIGSAAGAVGGAGGGAGSYTHLTPPASGLGEISGGARSLKKKQHRRQGGGSRAGQCTSLDGIA